MNDKVVELNREYWGRVHDMCAGTLLEKYPWNCVRWRRPEEGNKEWKYVGDHPNFRNFHESTIVEFAVDVLEDRPLWIGDTIYHRVPSVITESVITGHDSVSVELDNKWSSLKKNLSKFFTWTPPAPKRTFTLNGVDLPCPVHGDPYHPERCMVVITNGFMSKEHSFKYKNQDDARLVREAIIKLLTEARDKP